jgi:DNA-binding CsgD family transcriptional regulator
VTLRRRPHTNDGPILGGVLAAFLGVAALAAVDVGLDLHAGTTVGHVVVEGAVVLVALAGSLLVGNMLRRRLARARAEASALAERLRASETEVARFRDESREPGLGAVIDRQLERWGLTPAEKEVAMLLLKGLSHKEVASVRGITEATARQQARSAYRKAGVSGRVDLAAFFLEDLLVPGAP